MRPYSASAPTPPSSVSLPAVPRIVLARQLPLSAFARLLTGLGASERGSVEGGAILLDGNAGDHHDEQRERAEVG
jgi:hypothetical protein